MSLLIDLLIQIPVFALLYYLVMAISLWLVRVFLATTPYCIDRIGFQPFFSLWLSREHATTRRGVPRDIFTEIVIFLIPNIILGVIFALFWNYFDDTFLLAFFGLALMTSLIIGFVGTLVFTVRIIINPLSYSRRTFIHSNNTGEKAEYFHDSFTQEETYEVYKQKRFAFVTLSYLVYYYNLTTTMIDGWIRIKRKATEFLTTYGFMVVIVPIFVLFVIFVPNTGTPEVEELQRVEIGTSIFSRNGPVMATFLFIMGVWVSVYIPLVGFFDPEVEFGLELIVNRHNGDCKCGESGERCRNFLSLMVNSYRDFENQLKVKS